MTETRDRLNSAQEDWNNAEPHTGGGGLPPDGVYQAKIARFDLVESEFNGHLQLQTEMEIDTGDHAGRAASTWHDLEDPERFQYLKGHLQVLGLDTDAALGDIEETVAPALDAIVEIRIKTKRGDQRDYTNVYVNKLLQSGNAQRPAPQQASTDGDEDIDF